MYSGVSSENYYYFTNSHEFCIYESLPINVLAKLTF